MRETYFETELQYLAKDFDRVIILPKYNPYKVDASRKIPSNVEVIPPVLSMNKSKRFVNGIFSAAPIGFYFEDFRENKIYLSFGRFKSWFQSLLMHRIIYRKFKNLLREIEGEIVIYSYWADAPVIGTRLLEKHGKFVRMHRWDFYIEEHKGYLPVRRKIYQSADMLLPISEEIRNRLIRDYGVDRHKIHLSNLGVLAIENKEEVFAKKDDGVLRIVSCSRVDPIKRVGLIADAIFMLEGEQSVEWHHFGDGINFDALKEKVSQTPEHISIHLHGWTEQSDIYRFYRQNYITWFINVSRHEGVPVSIMEAISFGVPSIATDVGATREMVNENNGFLVLENITANELAELILSYKRPEYVVKREKAYQMWEEKFNADKNYKMLVEKFKDI